MVWGRVLKELDLRLSRKVNGVSYTGSTTNPSCVRARPRGAKSSILFIYDHLELVLSLLMSESGVLSLSGNAETILSGTKANNG